MATRKKGKPRSGKNTKKRQKPSGNRVTLIIDTALELVSQSGWRSLTLAGIAERTGLGLAEIRVLYPCKAMILNGLISRIDEQILVDKDAEGDNIRDRLFDLLMRRFDALDHNKTAIAAIAREAWCDPAAALITGPRMLVSMHWMLEAAGAPSTGLMGAARCKVLGLIYANAFRVWLNDDSADMGPTMAALDQGLRQAERFESFCRGR